MSAEPQSHGAFDRHPLDRLFRPRSVVLVGASENSAWSQLIHGNLVQMAYPGAIYLVNKRGAAAHGQDAVTSCTLLPAIPDLAYIFVPTEAVADALHDVAAAGIRHVMILSSGFGEAGAKGAALQHNMVDIAQANGIRFMGPNSLGFINYADAIAVSPFPVEKDYVPGTLGIVSQSGATTNVIAGFAQQQGIGLSYAIATGNEADVGTAEVVDFLVADPATSVIVIFAETIGDMAGFRAVAQQANAAGKPLIVLKVGRTELATQLAQAHTGSVTGDDRVFDAVCLQDNIIRVDTIEELVVTAGILCHTGPIEGSLGIISISGGACEIVADTADTVGLPLPAFAPETNAGLREMLPDFGSVYNPLDVTGAAVRDPSLFERILTLLAHDPAIGLTACIYDLPRGPDDFDNAQALACIGRGLAAGQKPGLLINQSLRPVSAHSRAVMARNGIAAVTGGLDHAVRGLAHAVRWSRNRDSGDKSEAVRRPVSSGARPQSELEALAYLSKQGVPVIPHRLVLAAGEAIDAWQAMGSPVVLKIASPAILHKSDFGGVCLNLNDAAAIEEAFDGIIAAARVAYPDAPIDGCLIAPMRSDGIEMFVGTARTAWGPAIVTGLGGIWIEALDDTSLRLLPITRQDARDMLDALKARRILGGYRGGQAVDLDALADAIVAIGDAALALGPDLVALEVNPLRVHGSRIEALDALPIWDDAA